YTLADGDSYTGEFKDNLMHGQGVFTYSDGRKISGEFRNNEPVSSP
ncbi:MAG TPA: cytoplasmic protein, partial [Leptospiraceae bacterium]|nr:cytoplasmic protein [Leptospiraceae bacterium]